jgi:hypothetical protein
MVSSNIMSRAELIRLAREATTIDIPTAGRALGYGVNASYEAHQRGQFPVRVLRLGRKLRVPTADLLAALGITIDELDTAAPMGRDEGVQECDEAIREAASHGSPSWPPKSQRRIDSPGA